MQVTCSNCGARYAVDPVAIGPSGRTVQCARCDHRWFEKLGATPAEPTAPKPPEQPAVPDFAIHPQTQGADLPTLTRPQPNSRWGRWLAAAIGLVVVLGVAAFAYRDRIVDRLPPEWRPLLNLDTLRILSVAPSKEIRPAPPAKARLEIDLDASKIELVDGRYVVRGEVVNTGNGPGSTSKMRVIFRKNDDLLGERSYVLIEGPIGPGARLSFSQTLDDPPTGTTDIVPAIE